LESSHSSHLLSIKSCYGVGPRERRRAQLNFSLLELERNENYIMCN
jgi:hypothetical protein